MQQRSPWLNAAINAEKYYVCELDADTIILQSKYKSIYLLCMFWWSPFRTCCDRKQQDPDHHYSANDKKTHIIKITINTQLTNFLPDYGMRVIFKSSFTARVRNTTGGYVFIGVCLSTMEGGGPLVLSRERGYPLGAGLGGIPPQTARGGYPTFQTGHGGNPPPPPTWTGPGIGRGVPHSRRTGYAAGGTQEDFLVI